MLPSCLLLCVSACCSSVFSLCAKKRPLTEINGVLSFVEVIHYCRFLVFIRTSILTSVGASTCTLFDGSSTRRRRRRDHHRRHHRPAVSFSLFFFLVENSDKCLIFDDDGPVTWMPWSYSCPPHSHGNSFTAIIGATRTQRKLVEIVSLRISNL